MRRSPVGFCPENSGNDTAHTHFSLCCSFWFCSPPPVWRSFSTRAELSEKPGCRSSAVGWSRASCWRIWLRGSRGPVYFFIEYPQTDIHEFASGTSWVVEPAVTVVSIGNRRRCRPRVPHGDCRSYTRPMILRRRNRTQPATAPIVSSAMVDGSGVGVISMDAEVPGAPKNAKPYKTTSLGTKGVWN